LLEDFRSDFCCVRVVSRRANLGLGRLNPRVEIAKIQPDEATDSAEGQIAAPAHFTDGPRSNAEIFAGAININQPLELWFIVFHGWK
jgi:hypothetical protein